MKINLEILNIYIDVKTEIVKLENPSIVRPIKLGKYELYFFLG